jgi:hypothetical protein
VMPMNGAVASIHESVRADYDLSMLCLLALVT